MIKKQKSKTTKKALLPRKPPFPPGCCSVSELCSFGALTHLIILRQGRKSFLTFMKKVQKNTLYLMLPKFRGTVKWMSQKEPGGRGVKWFCYSLSVNSEEMSSAIISALSEGCLELSLCTHRIILGCHKKNS